MRKIFLSRSIAALAMVTAIALAGISSAADPVSSVKPLKGISKPSDERLLSYSRPGLIAKVLVKEGDAVTKDQLLAQQDDTVEQAELASDKLAAENTTEVKAEQLTLEKDKADFVQISKPNVGSDFEKRDAELKVAIDNARIDIAEMKQKMAKLKYDQTAAAVDRLKLKSPTDGVVLKTFLKVGESADNGNMKAMQIVRIDPMWVEVPVPIAQARNLTNGDAASIAFRDNPIPLQGKIIYRPDAGDSASETIMVRIEVPNPKKLTPGENVLVTFGPAPLAVKE